MKKILHYYYLIIILFSMGSIFYASFFVSSYVEKITHPALTEQAAILYNKRANIGLSSEEIEWLKKGSSDEDKNPRYINHFYDPITKKGLEETVNGLPAKSAVEWAHSSYRQTVPLVGRGDFTWESAIYYYQQGDKEAAYIALGHVLHLMEDMGVPAHVRSDDHLLDDPYEKWVENYLTSTKLNLPNIEIKECSDLDTCIHNLAYYTNINFFSLDTIYSTRYNYPAIDGFETVIANNHSLEYGYQLINGEKIKLVRVNRSMEGILTSNIKTDYIINSDENIHRDYFSHLAPEVISYAAGVIKLFHEEVKKKQEAKPLTWWQEEVNTVKSDFQGGYEIAKETVIEDTKMVEKGVVIAGQGVALGIEKSAEAIHGGIDYMDNKIILAFGKFGLDVSIIKPKNMGQVLGDTARNVAMETREIKEKIGEAKSDMGNKVDEAQENIKEGIKENIIKPFNKASKKIEDPIKTVLAKVNPGAKLSQENEKKEEKANSNLETGDKDNNEVSKKIAFNDIKYVIDGDTIELKDGQKIRYIGIDSPELNDLATSRDDECMAWVARERNYNLLKESKEITLASDKGADKDKYGRLLRYVYANTIFVNKSLVQEGLAKIFICEGYMKNCPVMRDKERLDILIAAGKDAVNQGRGIFSGLCNLKEEGLKKIHAESLNLDGFDNYSQFVFVPGIPDLEEDFEVANPEPEKESKNNEENKDPGQYADFLTDVTPPKTKLNSLIKQDDLLLVSWDANDTQSKISSYDLRYKIDENFWVELLTATTATSTIFNLPELMNSQEYCFQARATDQAGNREEWAQETNEQIKCSLISARDFGEFKINFPLEGMVIVDDKITIHGTVGLNDLEKNISLVIRPPLAPPYQGGENKTLVSPQGEWEVQAITLVPGINILTAYLMNEGEELAEVSVNVERVDNDEFLSVVINEISWMGTKASFADEWLELYNNTGFPLILDGWKLRAKDGKPDITLSGVIKPYEYYLLERTDDHSINDMAADLIYNGDLGNEGESLELRDAQGILIDYIECPNEWHAGDNTLKRTMERIDPTLAGIDKKNWASNDGIIINSTDAGNNPIFGTPKNKNSATIDARLNPHQIKILSQIEEDQYLTKMKSPYLVSRNIGISESAVLYVGKGTIIKFDHSGILSVKGGVEARGTQKWPIVFTSYKNDYYGNADGDNTLPQPGDWGRIEFDSAKDSRLEYAIISYGGFVEAGGADAAVKVTKTKVDIINTLLEYNKDTPHNPAVLYVESLNSQFLANVLRYNGGGIKVNGGETSIIDNMMENNAGNGIVLQGLKTKAEISDNKIVNNHNPGATHPWESAFAFNTESPYFIFRDNIFSQNDFDGIFLSTTLLENITLPKAVYSLGDMTIPKNYTLSLIPGTVFKNYDSFITLDGKIAVVEPDEILFTSFYDDSPETGGDSNNDNGNILPQPGPWHWRIWNSSGEELPEAIIMRYGGEIHGQ